VSHWISPLESDRGARKLVAHLATPVEPQADALLCYTGLAPLKTGRREGKEYRTPW
jgi:hypothetical protein